jgi:hypothetical protein
MQNFEKPAENLRTILNVADPNSPHFNTFLKCAELTFGCDWVRKLPDDPP